MIVVGNMEKQVRGRRADSEILKEQWKKASQGEEQGRKRGERSVMMLRVVCAGTRPRHDEGRLDRKGQSTTPDFNHMRAVLSDDYLGQHDEYGFNVYYSFFPYYLEFHLS